MEIAQIDANLFAKCAPAIATNIRQCGTVTTCNAQPLTQDDLEGSYTKNGDYKVMDALLKHDFEVKMCDTVQNGLYDFLMANKRNWRDKMTVGSRASSDYLEISPFVKGKRYSPINNQYWKVQGIQNTTVGGSSYWQVTVSSTTNIPADVRSFPTRQRVFVDGLTAGGVATKTQWEVAEVTDNGDNTLTLLLKDQNSASFLDTNKVGHTATAKGIMQRGTPNVSDYEKFCAEPPAYRNWNLVPFWIETTRTSMCKSTLYDKWRRLLLEGNALFAYNDLDDVEKNRQLGKDWQERLLHQMFWGKALPNQTAADFDQLDEITSFDGGDFGVDGAKCVGKRANAIGIYEQLAECGRITDLQGGILYLRSLFAELYNMMRVREGYGAKNPRTFDIFTDSNTAAILNQAFILYYKNESQNLLQLNMPVEGWKDQKKADFGFFYRSYPLNWPQGVWVNIITHNFFDDRITAAAINDVSGTGYADSQRVLWILDFPGIYPGILASNRLVLESGKDLRTLASINPEYACVMKVNSQQQTLTSLTWTMVVECPKASLIIENFACDTGSNMPNVVDLDPNTTYPPTTTTTTTTTAVGAGIFKNTAQEYTAFCPEGTTGEPVTVTIDAETSAYNSTVSQEDANQKAMAAAQAQAEAALSCDPV